MAVEVIMPALGMTQETGILVEWLKSEGDAVERGEPLMLVETDKSAVEIESPGSGTLRNVIAKTGDEFPVGTPIAVLVKDGEAVPEIAASTAPAGMPEPEATRPTVTTPATPLAKSIADKEGLDLKMVARTGDKVRKSDVLAHLELASAPDVILASPKAKRLADEASIPLSSLTGSGPDGAIIAADVMVPGHSLVQRHHETSRLWQVMAKRLTESWQNVPHFYLTYEAKADGLNNWYRSLKKSSEKVTVTDLLTRIVAHALELHPQVNGSWRNQAIVFNEQINVGLAVAIDDGLVVPVIHNANQRSIDELTDSRRDLIGKARSGSLRPDDFANGTFTISNLGMLGVSEFSAIVNPPQAAILAVGQAQDRAVVENGQLVVRNQMSLTLSCDHRVVDGAIGARFMQALVSLIESPALLIK